MGKLMKRASRVLRAGVVMLAGAGVLMLAGAGVATAQPASTSGCQKVDAALSSINTTLATTHGTKKQAAALVGNELTKAASTGSPALKSAVGTAVTDLEAAAASNDFNMAKLNADGSAIAAACASSDPPRGAPATGGGGAAGIQDPALFGLGGAGVLAGIAACVLGLARRSRPQTRTEQG